MLGMPRSIVLIAAGMAGVASAALGSAVTVESAALIPAAALAVGCSISLIVIGITAVAYVLLGASD